MTDVLQEFFTGQELSFNDIKQLTNWPDAVIEELVSLGESDRTLSARIAEYEVQSGTGSPEGVITANRSKQYIDEAGQTLYFNPTLGAKVGWTAA